jgi:hypothetical protein
MFRTISLVILLATAAFGQDAAKDEAQVWSLEKAYWEYVKANDLARYRALWHEDFLGWPLVSPSPVVETERQQDASVTHHTHLDPHA